MRTSAFVERIRASLFFIPMLGVVVAVIVASMAIAFDSRIDQDGSDLPLGFTSTVDSARALLGTVAGATITFAAIAFSVSLLIIQQASSQYSPRVVRTLFRDPFNKRVMGLVVGTFTYCLLILRSVRSSLEQGGDPVIPNLSVAIGVTFGIITILAIVAFIDHSAHSMDISTILEDVEDQAITQIRREWQTPDTATTPTPPPPRPSDPVHVVRFDRSGWVQQIDLDKAIGSIPTGQTMWVETYPGRYAIEGTPIGDLSSVPDDADAFEREVLAAIRIGDTRTMQQDVSFGLRQLADIALKALSPSINDPTTAQDAIFHSAAVLAELLRREPPSSVRSNGDGTRVVLVHQPTHDDLIRLAFDEVRQTAASMPEVCIYLLEALELLTEAIDDSKTDRAESLRHQAELVVAGCAAADSLPVDIHNVEQAFQKRFETR
nr:DUF2254 domain-containing protein [Rhabdothermincola salaria]